MDRKLFLQSLNQQKQDYTKIRKDRRNTLNEFKWLFEENNTRRVLNEKESSDPTFMQQAAAALLPQSWAQATGLFDQPDKSSSPEAKAARERMAAQRKAAEEAAAKREAEFVGPPAPEVEQPEPTVTTTSADAREIARDEKTGKDLDAFDPKDFDHNLKVYDRAMKRNLDMVQKGEMSKEQATSAREELQRRMESFAKDEKQKEQFKAAERGLDTFVHGVELVPVLGQAVAAAHAGSYALRDALYNTKNDKGEYIDSSSAADASEYKQGMFQSAIGAVAPTAFSLSGKALAAAGAKGSQVAANLAAKGAPQAAKAVEAAAATAKAIPQVTSAAMQSAVGKAGYHALGGVAGGMAGLEAAKKAELGLPATVAAVLAGSILGSRGAKALEKVSPGLLGKQVADPNLAAAAARVGSAVGAAADAVKEPARKAVASALIGTQALTQTLPAANVVPPRAPGIVSTTTAPVAPKAPVAPAETAPVKAPAASRAPAPAETAPSKASVPAAITVPDEAKASISSKTTVPDTVKEVIKSVEGKSTIQDAIKQVVQQSANQQQVIQQQAIEQQATGGGTPKQPEPPSPRPGEKIKPAGTPKGPVGPVATDDQTDAEDYKTPLRDQDPFEIPGRKLGEFNPGEATAYTKSSVGKREEREDQFSYSPFFRVPTQVALDYRRSNEAQKQGLPESVQANVLKQRIKGAVSRYLSSKEGKQLNKHLNSIKK